MKFLVLCGQVIVDQQVVVRVPGLKILLLSGTVRVTKSAGSGRTVYVSPANFSDIILSKRCQDIQSRKMKHMSISSFSIDTCLSSVFQVVNLLFTQIIGFVASTERINTGVVQEWLTQPDIINLELTHIAYWHEHGKIKSRECTRGSPRSSRWRRRTNGAAASGRESLTKTLVHLVRRINWRHK
jgi:hypothetical protein